MGITDHDTVMATVARAQALVADGEGEAAVALYDEVLEGLPALEAAGVVAASTRGYVLGRKAVALNADGETYEAVRLAREAFDLVEGLHRDGDPDTTVQLTALLGVDLARLLVADGEDDEAYEVGARVLPVLAGMRDAGDEVTALDWQGEMLGMLSRAQPQVGHDLTPLEVSTMLVDTQRRLVAAEPDVPARRYDLAKALQISAPRLVEHSRWGDHTGDEERDGALAAALAAGEEAVRIIADLLPADPDGYVTDFAQAVCAYAGVLWSDGRDDDAESAVAGAAQQVPAGYAGIFPLMVQAWEWISAPTFAKEESVLREYEDELLGPDADRAVELMLGCVGSSEQARLAALRRAAAEVGVSDAYERRAEDPMGFLFSYG